uniref:Uncharacterized protein n=1 Tax=Geospiza parvula TaxID=87175 RepID=A0A8C3MCF8_GEOPR
MGLQGARWRNLGVSSLSPSSSWPPSSAVMLALLDCSRVEAHSQVPGFRSCPGARAPRHRPGAVGHRGAGGAAREALQGFSITQSSARQIS